MPKVSRLRIYPVKSCGGIDVDEARIGQLGFELDRHWIVIDGKGEKLTQRERPRLALVKPSILGDVLKLDAEGHGGVDIDIAHPPSEKCRVNVWGDDSPGLVERPEVNNWISEYLGEEASILRFDLTGFREVGETWGGTSEAGISFTDCTPAHIATESSLAALNEWRKAEGLAPTPIDRFRPNIVLTGSGAWEEDTWPALRRSDGMTLDIVRPTSRCRTTLVDQATGTVEERGNLHVLTERRLFKNYVGRPGAFFGVQALVIGCEGSSLRVGDLLEPCEQRAGLPNVPRFI